MIINRNHIAYAKQLLELGADPNFCPLNTAHIKNAFINNNAKMIELLFSFGARNGGECLADAIKYSASKMIPLLLKSPDLSDEQLQSGFCTAQKKDDHKMIQLLESAKNERIKNN